MIIVNLGSEAQNPPVLVSDEGVSLAQAWRFDEEDLLHELDASNEQIGESLHLPGYTITLLKFE